MLFRSIVDAVTCASEIESLNTDIVKFKMQRKPIDEIQQLLKVYETNPNKRVIKYSFIDQDNNTYITNKSGNQAFLVLRLAAKCLTKAFEFINYDDVICLEFHIAKSEIRRLDIYQKMLERLNLKFNASFKDDTTDPAFITFYTYQS